MVRPRMSSVTGQATPRSRSARAATWWARSRLLRSAVAPCQRTKGEDQAALSGMTEFSNRKASLVECLQEPVHRGHALIRGLHERRVAAVELEALDHPARGSLGDLVQLGERAVLVVDALDEQDGCGDPGQERADVERSERRVEPDVAPPEEGGIDVAMVGRHLLPQIAVHVALAHGRDLA